MFQIQQGDEGVSDEGVQVRGSVVNARAIEELSS